MVVLSQTAAPDRSLSLLKPINPKNLRSQIIPTIDLSNPNSGTHLVKACEEVGFFKVTNHGISNDLIISPLEEEALRFFNLPLYNKEKAGSPSPFGYGSKKIGLHGDVGWLEYLLLSSSFDFISNVSRSIFSENPDKFSSTMKNYVAAMKKMTCRVLEEIAHGLKMEQNDAFSRMVKDEKSDSCLRLNHYPPYSSNLEADLNGGKLLGFGEHTDPHLISILRSNNTSGFQILTKDGKWVSVPPDDSSFFVIVGDSLQVMSNGRFKSVKHRVLAEGKRSRISMIYFGGPPLTEKITALPSLMGDGEESLYKEFTWWEYKKAMYKTRLADHRLGPFEKKPSAKPLKTALSLANT